jgi:hypothetical protein
VFDNVLKRLVQKSRHAVASRTSGVRSEVGETLVEVLLALVILALASVAMITAFGTDISASAEHRSLANFDTALASSISMTTTLIQQDYSSVFTACPTPSGSLAGYPTSTVLTSDLDITGYTASITAVEYTDTNGFSATCTAQNVGGPQLITIVVTDTATGLTQSNSVAVINPAPTQASGGHGKVATQLVFSTQPGGATVGTAFQYQPILEVQDASGQIVTTDLSPITLTITTGTGTNGASLSTTCSGVETSGVVVYSGCSINEVGNGYTLTATEPAPSGPGVLTSTSAPFSVYSTQLATPTITSVVPSTVTAGALNVTFTGSANAPSGESYTVKACTDNAMSANCTQPTGITSGSDVTGLVPGTTYYVQITATATSSFLASTSPPDGPTMATAQLAAPSTPVLSYGTAAGSLSVAFTPPPTIAAGQTYTVKACTNTSMGPPCVSNTNFTSGGTFTGLAFVPGSTGTLYYVQVTANASAGYLVSAPSPTANHPSTSQVKTPTGFSAASSASQIGAITASFTEPTGGTAPSSFTATACTDAAMTVGCVSATNYTSGAPLSGLTAGATYYVQVTAVASSAGFVSATTAVSSPTVATVQLTAPSGVAVDYGSVAGSVSVTFTPPAPAAAGQTYTVAACTNAAMSTGCVSNANFTSGNVLAGLAYTVGNPGANYWVQVTANASSGYLVSPPSSTVSHAAMSQIGAPGTPTAVNSSTTAGAIVVTFASPSGTAPYSYNAAACTNTGMTSGCVYANNYTSGSQFTGLTVGTRYYVQITAVAPTGFVNNNSVVSSSILVTYQLVAPTGVTAGYGTVAGSLSVNFTPPANVAPGQTYTAKACTNAGMTNNCVTNANYTAGTDLTGLTFAAGNAGTTYWVQVTANASPGYLASPPSATANHADTSQIGAPGTPTAVTSSISGAIVVTFSAPSGPAPSSYNAMACTDTNMTQRCVTVTNYTSGAQFGGLRSGRFYYVQITAVAPSGYVNNISNVSTNSTMAR